ncbi:MAG: 2-hydroxyacid dehydrogenase [Erysipelotrichaceae bacterium]|nr:2-hydroxyacid dehydrogenase [Erysipelotrichaceae bacterium]
MKVLTSIPAARFEKYGAEFPEDWEVSRLPAPFTLDDVKAAGDADFVFIGSVEAFTGEMMDVLPSLKMIHTEGVGFDKVDVAAAKQRNIPVCNNRAVNNGAVAEHTVGLMLASLRRIPQNMKQLKKDGFVKTKKDFLAQGENEIAGKKVGFVGFGAIGKEAARRLQNFDVEILYYDAFRPSEEVEKQYNASYRELDDLCKEADIISIHVPVLPSTVNMFNKERFAMMKKTALLVNTARGEIVDNEALAQALETDEIYGAALDVVSPEPMPEDHIFFRLSDHAAEKLIITTHVGGVTNEAFERMLKNGIANMQRVAAGQEALNIVNK